jgi:hypothetical protein
MELWAFSIFRALAEIMHFWVRRQEQDEHWECDLMKRRGLKRHRGEIILILAAANNEMGFDDETQT